LAAIPITGARLQAFPVGAQFSYILTFTVNPGIPDPNTWTDFRLSIVNPGITITVPKSSMTLDITVIDTGGWTLVATIPLLQTDTTQLIPTNCTFQIDFTASGVSDALVLGNVEILQPNRPLEAP
jgi:hypothetical protein